MRAGLLPIHSLADLGRFDGLYLTCREFNNDSGDIVSRPPTGIQKASIDVRWTACGILRVDGTGDDATILSQRGAVGGDRPINFRWGTSNELEMFINNQNDAQSCKTGTNTWNNGEWGVAFGCMDGGGLTGTSRVAVYDLDGSLKGEGTTTSQKADSGNADWGIGSNEAGADTADAQIALVCWFVGYTFTPFDEVEFTLTPLKTIRRLWRYLEFAISPLTGRDYSRWSRHFTVTTSSSIPGVRAPIAPEPLIVIPTLALAPAGGDKLLAASLTADAEFAADLAADRPIAAVLTADADFAAVLATDRNLVSALTVDAEFAAVLAADRPLVSNFDAAAELVADLVADRPLVANLTVDADFASVLDVDRDMVANLTVDADFAAALTVTTGGEVTLAAALTADGDFGAILALDRTFSEALTADADFAAICDVDRNMLAPLTVDADFAAELSTADIINFVADFTADAELAADLIADRPLAAGLAGDAEFAALLVADRPLVSAMTADAEFDAALTATAAGTFQAGIDAVYNRPQSKRTYNRPQSPAKWNVP